MDDSRPWVWALSHTVAAIVFDMDGTIIDSREAYVLTLVEVCRELGHPRTRDVIEENLIPSIAGTARRVLPADKRLVKRAEAMIRRLVWKRASSIALCPGATQTLEMLKSVYRLGLLTASDQSLVDAVLGPSGVLHLFDQVVTIDSALPTKDERYRHLLDLLGVEPGEAVMVGDTPSDVEVARKAGSRTAAIYNSCSWQWGRREELLDSGPDAVLSSLTDLLTRKWC